MSSARVEMPAELRSLRVALVHDYLNQIGGAEKVVEVFVEMFPEAPLFTSVYDSRRMGDPWRKVDIRTTFLQRFSPRLGLAKMLFPLYPTAFELFDFRGYDLVLSSTTAFAKGILTRPETCHVCYCNNPTRFIWMYHEYFEHAGFPALLRAVFPWMVTPLRVWDYAAAQRVDEFVAGSHNAARRIAKYYRRESEVLQPPIDADHFRIADTVADYFLVVSRLQPYKRIDLAVRACNKLRLPLRIVGDGSDRSRLQALAGPTVQLLGRLPDTEVREQMAHCRALIFPGEEDFGLTPLEAQASGRPVVAYGAGGARETVKEGVTGVFFDRPTVDALTDALEHFTDTYDPREVRAHALQFDKQPFKRKLYDLLLRCYRQHQSRLGG